MADLSPRSIAAADQFQAQLRTLVDLARAHQEVCSLPAYSCPGDRVLHEITVHQTGAETVALLAFAVAELAAATPPPEGISL